MKTLNLISALTVLLVALTTPELNASTPDLKLGDVKFGGNEMMSGSLVVENTIESNALSEFDFEDEAYIEDIPFDTECVTTNCRYKKAMAVVFEMEEENYINDIPFDIKNIAQNSSQNEIDFEDEAYIDDIPFSTLSIATKADFKNNLTVK
jgi:hypothetical protein